MSHVVIFMTKKFTSYECGFHEKKSMSSQSDYYISYLYLGSVIDSKNVQGPLLLTLINYNPSMDM